MKSLLKKRWERKKNFEISELMNFNFKVEFFLKGSLESIPSPSPSLKIQIMGVKAKHCWRLLTNFQKEQFVDITQQCFAFLPRVNVPAHNLNFQ